MMSKHGFTLIEVMVTVSIMVIVMGIILGFSIMISDAGKLQEIKAVNLDEAQKAMLLIVKELRQAAMSSITGLNSSTITYRIATDKDGNSLAVDKGGNLELSAIHTLSRDINDVNKDKNTTGQLIFNDGTKTIVLANHVQVDEDTNKNGTLDSGEDTNKNSVLDHGLWFTRSNNSIIVTLQIVGTTRDKHPILFTMQETVTPRN